MTGIRPIWQGGSTGVCILTERGGGLTAGRRKSVAFLTLKEAADYARFACAAYAVFEHENKDVMDDDGNKVEGRDGKSCGCCCTPGQQLKTYATVVRSGALNALLTFA